VPLLTNAAADIRVPLPSDAEIRRVIGADYDANRTLNVIRMFAGTDDMYPAVMGFIKAVFHADGVDPCVREMIALRTAKQYNARYEWEANAKLASNVGLSSEEIAAAASDGQVNGIDPKYILACIATDELSDDGRLSDETLTELLERYGHTVTRKLILIIGWFNLLSRFVNGCRVPLETIDKIGNGRSPV
jgi:alkylhydroperoxidase family enzyme